MILRCDVVKCIYNKKCKCIAGVVDITLTHDNLSGEEYIACITCIEESDSNVVEDGSEKEDGL